MAQVITHQRLKKGKAVMKIKVPRFDNSELIKGCSRTLIGRAMNLPAKDINHLIFLMPKIWKVENRVIGKDLILGRFQFDFQREDNIQEVLKMGPFQFDYWMVSLVWEPVVHYNYPSNITFWIKVLGVPRYFWVAQTFISIGKGLETYRNVDVDDGMVRVTIYGFTPFYRGGNNRGMTVDLHGENYASRKKWGGGG